MIPSSDVTGWLLVGAAVALGFIAGLHIREWWFYFRNRGKPSTRHLPPPPPEQEQINSTPSAEYQTVSEVVRGGK
ncbi:MAG: hypothetical protein ABSE07_02310 [Methanoregula sp.]